MKSKITRLGARSLLLALSFLATAAFAQQAVQELDALEPGSAANAPLLAAAPVQIRTFEQSAGQRVSPHVLVLPELAGAKAALAAPAPGQPLQIGLARALPDAAHTSATASLLSWSRAAGGGQRAALSVRAPGAKGLRLGVLVEQLPPSALLRVYAPDSAQVTEITAAEVLRTIQANVNAGDNSAAAHTYWLPTVQGAEAALEIELPAGVSPSQLKVSVPTVSHLVMLPGDTEAMTKGLGDSASCQVDVMCTSGNQNEMQAVARMSFVKSNGIPSMCTGTLLNNSRGDRTPYFLSANHCISTQTGASTLETLWNYRSSSCNSNVSGATQTVIGGADLLYNSGSTDTSFMRLKGTPPSNATFAGWNANTAVMGTDVFGIHHPVGDLQKYNRGAITNVNSIQYEIVFSQGVTESGSSGSALFTASGRQLIGQLSGGNSSCTNLSGSNYYGRFDLAYNASLKTWLSPAGPPAFSISGSAGTGGTISPASATVNSGSTYTFTVTPNSGYYIASISGCGGSTFNGGSSYTTARPYTTGAITAACTVTASFAYTDDCSPASTATNCVWSNLSTPITKAIETVGDHDWIRFTPTASGLWMFTSYKPLSNPLNDPIGALYNANGVMLASNDDGVGNFQFRVQANLTAGQTYYLEVYGFSSSTGNYTVTATGTTPIDDCSPASTATNCSWSNLSSPITKSIETVGDRDWIRFTPTTSGQWTFTASKPASSPLNDSVGVLHDASGATLATNDDGGGNLQFRVQANLTAGQTYYLDVYGYSSNTGNYTVTATAPDGGGGGGTDDCSPASTATNCVWSNLASPITKAIETAGDKDWIRFTPTASGLWTFTASKPASNPLSDSVGTLYNAGGTQLATNDDGAGSYQFRVQANLTAGQTYYLEVYGWSTYTGNYTVTATAPDGGGGGGGGTDDCSPASTATNCVWSNLASPITKAIETAGDKDWIRFTPTASGLWTFTASKPASNPLSDSVGTLYNAGGTQLATNDDGAGSYQFRVQANLTAGQTYYLEVYGWSTYTGNYTVTATH